MRKNILSKWACVFSYNNAVVSSKTVKQKMKWEGEGKKRNVYHPMFHIQCWRILLQMAGLSNIFNIQRKQKTREGENTLQMLKKLFSFLILQICFKLHNNTKLVPTKRGKFRTKIQCFCALPFESLSFSSSCFLFKKIL